MRHLFVKIFLWFWATVILTGISLVLLWVLQPQVCPPVGMPALKIQQDTLELPLPTRLNKVVHLPHPSTSTASPRTLISTVVSSTMPATHWPESTARSSRPWEHTSPGASHRIPTCSTAWHEWPFPSKDPDGHVPTSTHRSCWRGREPWPDERPGAAPLRVVVALLVSGVVCYFLTRYLTAPILHLRSVAQQIAAGELSVRADSRMELRRDELGDLVRDFNRMADKTEHLISSQRQLLYDVSHELRSPLARMNVALDLLRGRVRDDPALNRIGIDLQRLNEMIGRLLTVAKLEATSTLQTPVRVDLSELISSVVIDADFEANERGNRVEIVHSRESGHPRRSKSAAKRDRERSSQCSPVHPIRNSCRSGAANKPRDDG